MKRYDHLIVGGGMAGFAAAQAIRELDSDATIGMFGEEAEGPYDRTALSKGLWQGRTEGDIALGLGDLAVELVRRRVGRIDPERQTVTDESGRTVAYGKLLLTTGVHPRRLPFDLEPVHYLHSIAQYRRLRRAADTGGSFLVIGGGFLGAELACALDQSGNEVTMVMPEAGIGALMFPADLADHLTRDFRSRGVRVLPHTKVVELATVPDQGVLVTLSDGNRLQVDQVVAAVGSLPRTELALGAGIGAANGITVDEHFRTDAPNVFAAGDVASYPDPILGRRRVEHEDHARHSGRHAGLAMAGEATPYRHLPLFYSDLYDYGYEAVGNLTPGSHTFSRWEEPFGKGVIYYLDQSSRVRGVLLWNTWGLIDRARELVAKATPTPTEGLSLQEVGVLN